MSETEPHDLEERAEPATVLETDADQGLRRAGAMDPWDRPRSATATPFDDRVARSSPFPPIADYAFLSDCHTAALVAPDGTVEWLCPPRFDSPSVFAAILDRGAGGFRLGPVRHGRARRAAATSRAPTCSRRPGRRRPAGRVVRDALILGLWREREMGSATAHTRPPADHDAYHVLVRTIECFHGSVQVELLCEPMFDYGRTPGHLERGRRRPAGLRRRRAPGQRCACTATCGSGSRAARPARATASSRASAASARCRGRACSTARAPSRRRATSLDVDRRVLAQLARHRALPRPPLARPAAALGARAEGPDLRADGRRRRGADDLAAGDAGRRAQLGLPLHLDARRDAHAVGALLARPRAGRPTTSSSTSPTSSATADGSLQIMYGIGGERDLHRADARPPHRLRGRAPGADRQRRLRRSARTTSTARCSTRSTCTPSSTATARSGCGR